ncbi:alpha/beta hydrolase fold [Kosakonia arachidis]|uniref:Alpha/beta hydrolase fold n=1 Tax=Kosakonia arachidis TaxID=551989 RepID=A0A1I7C9K9_9ENTR|nr:alpha/beta hydrolase fold [Kosakonia arachidis]
MTRKSRGYCPGGGWVLGDFATHEHLVRNLVSESGAAAVFVNYTPSPEAHFPVAINQAYAATRWVAEIGVDGTRYNGLIHDYGLLNALSDVPAVWTALGQAAYELKEHLK